MSATSIQARSVIRACPNLIKYGFNGYAAKEGDSDGAYNCHQLNPVVRWWVGLLCFGLAILFIHLTVKIRLRYDDWRAWVGYLGFTILGLIPMLFALFMLLGRWPPLCHN